MNIYRNASENDSTADFVMQYGAQNGMLRRPRILDMLTMRQPPRFKRGRNRRTTRHIPNTLTSNSCVMLDWASHSTGPMAPGTPTLLTMPHNADCHKCNNELCIQCVHMFIVFNYHARPQLYLAKLQARICRIS